MTGLYNCNIAAMQTRLPGPGAQLMAYRYDQLNRIKQSRAYGPGGAALAAGETDRYAEEFWYDPNGNLTRATRYGANNSSQTDNLTYAYPDANTNRLGHVGNGGNGGGLPGQAANNYGYDATETSDRGNLVRDVSENITAIDWTVYGKVASVQKTTGNVTYLYDPAGQRVAKTANGVTTHYIRDASGNVMAIYENGALKELPIYGSSRLGVYRVLNGDLQTDRNKLILVKRAREREGCARRAASMS
jgi:YD repeat-containing protein